MEISLGAILTMIEEIMRSQGGFNYIYGMKNRICKFLLFFILFAESINGFGQNNGNVACPRVHFLNKWIRVTTYILIHVLIIYC